MPHRITNTAREFSSQPPSPRQIRAVLGSKSGPRSARREIFGSHTSPTQRHAASYIATLQCRKELDTTDASSPPGHRIVVAL
eukprot:6119056-Pleurochrysis_carterae.AAC.3